MQTFSFADSKLGYLTAAKGALVVRVKSCRMTRRHGTVTPHETLVVAASDNDVKTGCYSHIADESGNFTLVQRRSVSDLIHFLDVMLVQESQAIY